ncbi:helix-turn-helix transcriptional regulator [Pedobacter aquatilis]|uniref:helix-turn-helix domain-containing protein n=1 Tax=Pedobacter aquatilis TaxID=351343 RepID=UPI00292E54CC|nr:helix-turn-helix transcriptional regulator [Pedobacter aquatilis]
MGKEAHYKLITERIRLRRTELEFSQEYMAEQLDISQNTYSRNERDIRNVPLKRVLQIAVLLKLDILELLKV